MKESIAKELLQFNIIHGRALCSSLLYETTLSLPEVNISEDIHIVTVVDKYGMGSVCVDRTNFKNGKINYVILDNYQKWISKIEGLKDYISINYKDLPEYILYLDAFDTLILKDILNPKALLDYYNCKVLFNSEPAYWHTGFPTPDGANVDYYDKLYYEGKDYYTHLNKKKYNRFFDNGLNAGVFLGIKDYMLEILEKALFLMKDNPEKEFPHGCQDDQCTLRYLHNTYFDNISVDLYNNFFYWGCPETFNQPDSIYGINYFRKYNYEYNNGMVFL